MSSFKDAIDFTLKWEGGYVNDPDDPGGETKYGISKRSHPELNITDLTRGEAAEIYREKYWVPIAGDQLPDRTALVIFDWSVHSPRKIVVRQLQRNVGARVDGSLGPKTLARVLFKVGGPGGEVDDDLDAELASDIVLDRVKFLHNLMDNRQTLRKYSHGWMRRTHDLMRVINS